MRAVDLAAMDDAPVPLAFLDDGNLPGEPLLLLHGFPLHHRMWRSQQGVDPRVRIIMPDLRGFGASRPPDADAPEGPEGMARMARDVLALADRLEMDRFLLGGWSMGCDVALTLAQLAPDRIRGLVLANGRAEADPDEWREKHARNAERVQRRGVGALDEEMLEAYFTEKTREERPDLVTQVRGWIHEASVPGTVHALHALRDQPDQVPSLRHIAQPALIIGGGHDTMTPPDCSEQMAKHMPRARLRIVEDSAHLTPLERPAAFNDALREWLDEALAA